MNYSEFERSAYEVFEAIPERFRAGVEGLEVSRATVPHPSLPDIYTLGECITDTYPTEFGGAGEVRSVVVLYYGSFLALSRLDEEWDWGEEIYETVTHEVQHHLETLAAEEALEELDYAEDQNFARREGESFDPLFYRAGHAAAGGAWEVDGDLFVEVAVGHRERAAGVLQVEWEGRTHRVALPAQLPDVHFEPLEEREGGGELLAVLVRRRGLREWVGALLARRGGPAAEGGGDAPG
jgi:predicted Zn-dependent protease with MMP-like domain